MQQEIQQEIDRVEREKGIRILYAAESGSRAWGFASPDSDYDVRLIYTYPKDQYIQIKAIGQDINLPIDENLIDLSGWELLKAARLVVAKSNASPFEWIQSPIVYREVPGFRTDLEQVLQHYFRARPMVYHYLGLAKGTYMKYLQGPEVNIKKYFYALRPILCALWIQENKSVAPLLFSEVRQVLQNDEVSHAIDQLLKEKEQAEEGHMITADQVLQGFIASSLDSIGKGLEGKSSTDVTDEVMNEFLLKWIN